MNDALRLKRQEIYELSNVEEHEKRCGKKKEKLTEGQNKNQSIVRIGPKSRKKNKKSFEEEWDVHSAYQLLLSEHYKRAKTASFNKEEKVAKPEQPQNQPREQLQDRPQRQPKILLSEHPKSEKLLALIKETKNLNSNCRSIHLKNNFSNNHAGNLDSFYLNAIEVQKLLAIIKMREPNLI